MTLQLRPMTAAEYDAWSATAAEEYAAELITAMRLSSEEAALKATQNFAHLLPKGRATPDHTVCMIEDEHATPIGSVWFAEERTDGRERLYVYQIEINADERGRGFGRETMELVEAETRARGLGRIELNVWPSNHVARALYRSLEFDEISIGMAKVLD